MHFYFLLCFLFLFFFYYFFISFVLVVSMNIHYLPPARINILLKSKVFHQEQATAWDLDNVCTINAMKCLIGYALHPSFFDPAYRIFIGLAKGELLALECRLSGHIQLTQQFKLNHIDRSSDAKCLDALQGLITRLEAWAKKWNRIKAQGKATQQGKGKRSKSKTTRSPTVEEPALAGSALTIKERTLAKGAQTFG